MKYISIKKSIYLILCFFSLFYPAINYSFPLDIKNCENSLYLLQHPHYVLPCAGKILPSHASQLNYLGEEKTNQYTQYRYGFASLVWPRIFQTDIPDIITPNIWKHEVDIFIPKENSNVDTAALYITGGYIHSKITRNNVPDKIISQLIQHNIVVVLKDDPNQYLTINDKELKEDEIIAFTWNRFIHNPNLIYYPLHIPMAIAAQ